MTSNRDEYLLDIFTTALEGGIGYWSLCTKYHWSNDGEPDHEGFYAKIIENNDDANPDGGDPHTIDRDTIAYGLELGATTWRDRLSWSTGPPPFIIGRDTDWDFDAGDADMIVQLGLFEDVVYG